MQPGGDAGGHGLVASLRQLLATSLAALQTRLQLVSTEAEEQVVWISRLWLLSACALLLLAMGVLFASVFVLVLFWDTHRVIAAGTLALAYLAGGIVLGVIVRRAARDRPRPFAGTLAELARDRRALKGEA